MANTASAKKRVRANVRRTLRNRSARSALKTRVTRVRRAVDETAENVGELLTAAISSLDRAAVKGIVHPNNAARRKSRLMKRVAGGSTLVEARPPSRTASRATSARPAAAATGTRGSRAKRGS